MKGISFLTPMVLALLNTKPGVWPAEPIDPIKPFKWQTRRIIKGNPGRVYWNPIVINGYAGWVDNHGNPVKPKYRFGEIVYVKEGLYLGVKEDTFLAPTPVIYYDAGGANSGKSWRWKRSKTPPMSMPRDLARMELEIKSVRAERVQDITEEEATAEGMLASIAWTAYDKYSLNWESINGPGSWDSNPWVFAYEVARTK